MADILSISLQMVFGTPILMMLLWIQSYEETITNGFLGGYSQKSIFLRDVLKEWYVKGCGEEIQDIDAIIEFLRPYTIGYEIIVVGNSAGGYLAVILGNALNAKCVIDISGQVNIWQYAEDEKQYPELNAERDNPKVSKYYNIQELLNNMQTPIFYFYASGCRQDVEQWQLIQNGNNVFSFAFFFKESWSYSISI